MNRKLSRVELLCVTILALVLLLALQGVRTYGSPANDDTLRIGLNRCCKGVTRVTVSSSTDFRVMSTGSGERLASGSEAAPITLTAGKSEIILTRHTGDAAGVGRSVTVVPDDPSGAVSLDCGARSRQYRGAVEINFESGGLRLVNVVGIEDYLLGVVPAEMSHNCPEEALNAQAVVARTYAIRNQEKHRAHGYDLCDSTHCQVYDGVIAEQPECTRAVIDTTGLVLAYDGKVAHVMYSADCGGATANHADVYAGAGLPYLRERADPVEVPHRSWEKDYTVKSLEEILLRAGVREAAGLKAIGVVKKSPAGRAVTVEITGGEGVVTISASRLRAVLGVSAMPSTLFEVETSTDGGVTFKGKGMGHGVGMCQVGAISMAGAGNGYTYDRILAHYFPGTTISSLPSVGMVRTALKSTAKPQTSSGERESNEIKFQVRVKEPKF